MTSTTLKSSSTRAKNKHPSNKPTPQTTSEKFDYFKTYGGTTISPEAKKILDSMDIDNICSNPSDTTVPVLREQLKAMCQDAFQPYMTRAVAMTLLGFGLCQELSQRFVVEYCTQTGKQNIALIFLTSVISEENHVFVCIIEDKIKAPEYLFIENLDGPVELSDGSHPLATFIQENGSQIFIDPLLTKAPSENNNLLALIHNLNEGNLVVRAIRDYSNPKMLDLAGNAHSIMTKADSIKDNFATAITLTYMILIAEGDLETAKATQDKFGALIKVNKSD